MGMSQASISPAVGPSEASFEGPYDGPYQRPHVPSQLAEVAAGPRGGDGEDDLPEERYLDREESWLRFNERVLELAEDESVPLLERVRFLAIFANNLDEFFMVRVAGLVRRMVAGFPVEGTGVRLPRQVLEKVGEPSAAAPARTGEEEEASLKDFEIRDEDRRLVREMYIRAGLTTLFRR